jgi:hypothetical protein
MAAPRQGLPVRLERAPHRGAAFALSNASKSYTARPTPQGSGQPRLKLLWIEVGRVYDEEAVALSVKAACVTRQRTEGAASPHAEIDAFQLRIECAVVQTC